MMTDTEIRKIISRAVEVFDNHYNAIVWLTTDIAALGMEKPIDCDFGIVMDELGRIEYGVY